VVADASNAVQSKNSDIDNKESELRTVNEQLNKDYGKDKEWMKLDQQCFEKDEGE
jgi:protein kinase C substrate 80K-H